MHYFYSESFKEENMYAIFAKGGKQFKAEKGQKLFLEKLENAVDETVEFKEVLLVSGDKVKVGAPYVKGAKVIAKVLRHGKQKKVIVFKYKDKNNDKVKKGHRQPYTEVLVEDVVVA